MSEASWEDLLSTESADVERPPPIPKGTYRMVVGKPIVVEPKGDSKAYVSYPLEGGKPMDDVDPGEFQDYSNHKAIKGAAPTINTQRYWLTPKALPFLVDNFLVQACRLAKNGPVKKLVQDATNCTVLVTVKHGVAKDGETVYANIDSIKADVEAA